MASPLSIFRKYQYALLVVFGVMLMVAFVIAPPILDYQRVRSEAATNTVVVSWQGGTLRENDLRSLIQSRRMAQVFLEKLVQTTMARNGYPRVPRILTSTDEEDVVRSVLLAERAEKMGLRVSDEAIMEYLEQLSAELLPRNEIGDLFRESLEGRMSEPQLFNILRVELLAQNYMIMMHPSLFLARGEAVTPYAAWQYYERLNRRVKAEIIPLQVARLKSELKTEPSAAQIEALYNEAKDRYPNPDRPEPGFKVRRKIAFQYARADYGAFEQQEMPAARKEVTDAEVQQHYETNKQRYTVPTPPPTPPSTPSASATPPAAPPMSPPSAPPSAPADESAKPPTAPAEPAAKEAAPAGTAPVTETPAPAPPAKSEPTPPPPPKEAAPAPTDSSTPAAAPNPPAPPTAPAPADAAPPATTPAQPTEPAAKPESQSSDQSSPSSLVYVNWLADGAASSDPPPPAAAGPAADKSEPAPPSAAPAPTSEAKSAAESTPAEASKPAAESQPANDTKTIPEPASEAKPEPKAEPAAKADTATSPPGEAKSAAPPATPPSPPAVTTPSSPPVPQIRPLDDKLKAEIREELATSKARKRAQDRLDKVLAEVKREVDLYGRQFRQSEEEKPQPLDLESFVSQRGLKAGKTPLIDALEAQEYELGRSYEQVEFSWPPQRQSFAELAYADDIPLHRPAQIRGENRDVYFVYWKTAQQEAYVPELAKIRDQVIDAWKQQQALELAKIRAKEYAEKANKSSKSLKETFAGQTDLTVKETNDFSWLSTGFTPAGMGAPGLSYVDGVEAAGEDFMRSVFALKVGEAGVAVNEPHTYVYVSRIASTSPNDEELRKQFLEAGRSMEIQQVSTMAQRDYLRQWYQNIEKDLNVKWHRPALLQQQMF